MRKKIYVLLLILVAVIQTQAQITFKLKSVVGQQNPSSNGLFSYGTIDGNNNFVPFPAYGNDNTYGGGAAGQLGWTFNVGQESYPFLAYEQLNAGEVTPQPFPPFGVFLHPGESPSVVRLSIPNNVHILGITNALQRATFGCGDNIGYTIKTDNLTIFPRTIIATSNSPTTYNVPAINVSAGSYIYFIVDKGDDGSTYCDDTALDVEVTLQYDKIVTPILSGSLNCNATSTTFDIAFQQSGTLELYKLGNPSPIASTNISQVGNTFNGQGTFSGLDLSAGGSYYVIAKNAGQTQSEQSAVINVTPCCSNAVAPNITVNNLSLCQGEIGTLTATGCTNGTITWSNGIVGTSTTVNEAGTYTATCKVLATPPCLDATSTASGVVTVNALPTLTIDGTTCSADLLTYTVNFSDNGMITSSAGTVSGNSVVNIPAGLDVQLTATSSTGCLITKTVSSPNCTCPIVNPPMSSGNKSICEGQTIPALTVSVGENTTADWYDANLILLASNTLSYIPTKTDTYYVQARNLQNNCVSTTRTPVSLSVNALPTLSVGTSTCSADLLTYSVSFTSDGVVTSSAGIVSNNIVSGIPTGVNVVITATSSAGCVVIQTVNAPSCTCPTVNLPISWGDKTICAGQAIPTLSVSVGNNEVAEWFDAPNGGNLLATGANYTPSVATGMTFYVQSKNTITNCVSATRTLIRLSINALPILSVGTPTCSADLLTYSVSFTSNGVVTSSAGIVSNNIISSIPTGTNVVLTATSSAGCITTQTVNSPACICPTVNLPISGGDKTICAGQAIPTLSVSVGSNEVAEWYDAPIGGNLLATGLSHTPNVAIEKTFYVQSKNTITNCVSATRTPVSLSVNALPTLSVGTPTCSADLLTYSVSFTGNGVITSSVGIVSNNIISGIPTGTNVVLTATSSAGCITTQTVNSPACICPTVNLPISGGDKTICAGQAIPTLSVSVGSNEVAEWYDAPIGGNLLATGLNFTPNSETSNNGLFYVQARNATNNCASNARILVKLIVNSSGTTPKIVASKNPLVLGETATLSISNCNGIISWNTGESTTSISVTPKATTEYSATCTANGGCISGNGKITIEVNAPKIVVTASPKVVCIGGSTTLSMSGCPSNNIYWTSPEFGQRDEISPIYNGIVQAVSFTGHCVTSAGEATETIGVTIRQPQDFQITASKNPVILGESTVLSTTGCDGVVSWQNGQAVGNPITVWPINKYTEYVAECLSPNACGGKGKITIEVKPPVIQATGKDVCWGSTATLGQSGCTTAFYWVVWHNDDFMDAKPIDNPNSYPITQKTNFRVMCSTPVGEGTGDITINPIPLPNKPDIGSERTTYFLGETVRIGTGGCNGSVRWSNGENDLNTIEVKPRRTTKYTVTCVGGYGCTNSNEIEITMKTPPPTAKDQTICYGDTIKMVSGCMAGTEAHWTKNWMDIPNRVEVPEGFQERLTESNTYAVSCYDAETGWSEAVAIKVTVKAQIAPPIITAKGVEKTAIIVKGETIELLANACKHTEWKAESVLLADTLNKIQVKPLQTTTYHARCFTDGCYSEWSQFKVYVRPNMPVIKATLDTLCVGSSTIITAKNCEDGGTLVWLINRDVKERSFTVSPKLDITYKAICVSLDSMEHNPLVSDTTTIFIKVYQTPQKPLITGNLIILDGEKTTLTASGCEESLLWNTGEKSQSILVRPEKNTVYSATCGIWQCISDTASVKVRVRPRPIEIETTNGIRGYSITDTLCLNKQLTISTLTQCNSTIVWSNGQSGEKIEVTGTRGETQKYSLYCINADNEKSDETTATITVLDYNINDAIAYPNPTSGKLYIKSKGCIDGVKLILYSQRGEKLYEGGGQERYLDSLVLDLFNLPSETYILYIVGTDGNRPVTLKKRIVKVNN